MKLMRKQDPQLREDGFGLMHQIAPDHIADLITAFREESDHGLRCWLIELIGSARSVDALPFLQAQLVSADGSIRSWAMRGLEQLDMKEARRALWEHRRGTSGPGGT